MRNKFIVLLAAVVLILCPVLGYADVGILVDGTNQGATNHINFVPGGSSAAQSGRNFNVPIVSTGLVTAGTANGGASSMATSALAVPTGYSIVKLNISNDPAFNAKTLADGVIGQTLKIYVASLASGKSATLTPTTKTGFATLTFDAYMEEATLLYADDTTGWIVIGTPSATLTP